MLARLATGLAIAACVAACTGDIDGSSDMPTGSGGDAPMVDITGPAVLPHVQAYANAMCAATGACTISTYVGHDPEASRALDTLVSDAFGQLPSDGNALGDRVAQFALDHQADYRIMYVIWRQRYNDGGDWRMMEDRGSITQNHYDHVHVSFNY